MSFIKVRERLGLSRRRASLYLRQPRVGAHVWMPENRYQDMLYSTFTGQDAPEPLITLEELSAFTSNPADRVLMVHLEQAYSWGREGEELQRAFELYLGSLQRFSDGGGQIVWTIHDRELHLSDPEPARFARVRAFLKARAALCHVHSEAARRYAIDELGIAPERLTLIAHPSYAGVYPEDVTDAWSPPADGRPRLISFGSLRRYKNIQALSEALSRLPAHSFGRLTIAGQMQGSLPMPLEALSRQVALDLHLRFVADEELPALFNASDFSVLPYSASLTSGAATMAITFGKPVIAPALGGMRESVPVENHALIYDPADPDGLVGALARALAMTPGQYADLRAACLRHATSISPEIISGQLHKLLVDKGILGAAPRPRMHAGAKGWRPSLAGNADPGWEAGALRANGGATAANR